MRLTEEQTEVRDHAAELRPGNALKVLAFAGAGKTTTLKAIASARRDRGVYLAFNKTIADEARQKLATTKCTAMTMHALAFGEMRDVIDRPVQIGARSVQATGVLNRFHIPKTRGWGDYRVAAAVGRAIANFCASDRQELEREDAVAAVIEVVGDPQRIIGIEKRVQAEEALHNLVEPITRIAREHLVECLKGLQYSHDLYLKMLDLDDDMRQDAFRRFRYLLVDEAQDINPVQRSIIRKTGLPIIAVGDPFQQIYSWRGAENALELLPGDTLYLTQSFRFGEDIAAIARKILATRPDGGPPRQLTGLGPGDVEKHDGAAAAVICRTNIGMLDEAITFIDKGHAVHVDRMEALVGDARSALALFEGRHDDITSPDLREFDNWDELEIAAEAGDPGLARLARLVHDDRMPQIERLAAAQTADPAKAKVMICTGHRSKGMEWPAVRLGGDWMELEKLRKRHIGAVMRSATEATLATEEFNVLYVAATRPMLRLRNHERLFDMTPEEGPEPS